MSARGVETRWWNGQLFVKQRCQVCDEPVGYVPLTGQETPIWCPNCFKGVDE